ncbi:PREDICTED: gasdermin-A-like, partial [Eurypyga helias]|uniref:gasdermin-A-like n=1 Tax=Eurypyga helias TaxID=54383 RepID=UPI000528677E
MFKKVTQSIANEMDPRGCLIPVHSIFDHEHFRPLCLLTRKRKAIFHRCPRYTRTSYSLDDVMLPGEDGKSIESLLFNGNDQTSEQFTFKKHTSDKVDGNLNFRVDPTSVELIGAASSSQEWCIRVEKNHVKVPKLNELITKRKVNLKHLFIQQLKRTEQKLYVIYETAETSEETICEKTTEAEGSFTTHIYAKLCTKGGRKNKASLTIPKGCTLAFRPIQLVIMDASWGLEHFPKKKSALASDGSPEGKSEPVEREVRGNCQILSNLSSDLLVVILKAIKAVMRDRILFQELTQQMVAVLDGTDGSELKTESPDLKDLLSRLQSSEKHVILLLARAITYALDAFDELAEDQLVLLLEALETKIVLQQLKLVKSILEHNLKHPNRRFSVDASLLSFSQEEEQELTIAIVEMSGVKLQKDGSAVCMEDAFPAVAALYASLYVLNLLSSSPE